MWALFSSASTTPQVAYFDKKNLSREAVPFSPPGRERTDESEQLIAFVLLWPRTRHHRSSCSRLHGALLLIGVRSLFGALMDQWVSCLVWLAYLYRGFFCSMARFGCPGFFSPMARSIGMVSKSVVRSVVCDLKGFASRLGVTRGHLQVQAKTAPRRTLSWLAPIRTLPLMNIAFPLTDGPAHIFQSPQLPFQLPELPFRLL